MNSIRPVCSSWVNRCKAERWLAGIYKAIATLESRPERCPLAAESHRFPTEVRELLHGRRTNKHRIIFEIRGESVYVLYVRHSARDALDP